MNNKPDQCINCCIAECKHNNSSDNSCSLGSISIGTHEAHPTKVECTDCLSFEYKK